MSERSEDTPRKADASRRSFLRGTGVAAGATVLAGAGVLAAGPARAGTAPGSATAAPEADPGDRGAALEGSLVAHVSDLRTGRIVLFLDGREVVVTDPSLARTLARKAR